MPSIRKLCRRLERRSYARDICEFKDRTPDHATFSKFIARATPKTMESLFKEFRNQAFSLGMVDAEPAVKLSMDSACMHFIES